MVGVEFEGQRGDGGWGMGRVEAESYAEGSQYERSLNVRWALKER